ncbi:3D domain-containing protein [Oceanobacillus sp. CAU 1775]
MKKLVASLAAGILFVGAAVSTASAHEHEVQQGENLWSLAKEYNTTVDELVAINDLKTTTIQPKQIIYINETYVVQRGDTLIAIGEEYDVSVDELKDWNELESSLIVIGQELIIKGVNIDREDAELDEEAKAPAQQTTAQTSKNQTTNNAPATKSSTSEQPQGKTFSVTATAYTAECEGCSGITYTGVNLNKNRNAKVIAVDPNVIPLGSEVYVEGYGYAIAADIGSAIKGNKIDLHVPTKDEAFAWGVRTVKITIVK